ncbi:hypothetical protein ACVXG7_01245 [Enterobacter hormaechei]
MVTVVNQEDKVYQANLATIRRRKRRRSLHTTPDKPGSLSPPERSA